MWYLTILTAHIGFAILCISLFQSQPIQKYLTVGALPIFFFSEHLFSLAKSEWINRSMLEPQTSTQEIAVLVFAPLCQFGVLALYLFLDARHGKQMQKRVLLVYSNLVKSFPYQRK